MVEWDSPLKRCPSACPGSMDGRLEPRRSRTCSSHLQPPFALLACAVSIAWVLESIFRIKGEGGLDAMLVTRRSFVRTTEDQVIGVRRRKPRVGPTQRRRRDRARLSNASAVLRCAGQISVNTASASPRLWVGAGAGGSQRFSQRLLARHSAGLADLLLRSGCGLQVSCCAAPSKLTCMRDT